MPATEKLFLVCGTAAERDLVAHERGVDPRSIRLVLRKSDLCGHRGGRIVFGYTAGDCGDFDEIVAYARSHGIDLP